MTPNQNKQNATQNVQTSQNDVKKSWIRRHPVRVLLIVFTILMFLPVPGCGKKGADNSDYSDHSARSVNHDDKDVITAYSIGQDAYKYDYDIQTFQLKYGNKQLKVKGTIFEKSSGYLMVNSQGFDIYCHLTDISDYDSFNEGDRVIIEGKGTAESNSLTFDLHLRKCKVRAIKNESPELTLNIADFSKAEAQNNITNFESKYLGKYLKIQGNVYKTETYVNNASVILKSNDDYLLNCYIDKSIANNYHAGDPVEIEGELNLMDNNSATIKGCKINKSNAPSINSAPAAGQQDTNQPIGSASNQDIENQKAELKRKNLYIWDDSFVPNPKQEEKVPPVIAAANYMMKVIDPSIYTNMKDKEKYAKSCESLFFWYPECSFLALKLLVVTDLTSKRGPVLGQLTEGMTNGTLTCSNIKETAKDVNLSEFTREDFANVKNQFCAIKNPFDVTSGTQNDSNNGNSASDTQNGSYKGKRCDIQTISNEKHLPRWNIEIIDASVTASMLKDAEKAHLPFLKINASDDLKQKLEDYINKDPSKLNTNSQEAFSCEPGKYIKTAGNIGIQHILCENSEMSVAFLNLVSPVDSKARVYQTKSFDHLFEDTPVIDKTEEIVINGERGVYVAVKYSIDTDGTGTEHSEIDIINYLFLGDKLRYLTDWNAFHIDESFAYPDEGEEEYSCDARATVLRLESTGSKEQVHTFAIPTSN